MDDDFKEALKEKQKEYRRKVYLEMKEKKREWTLKMRQEQKEKKAQEKIEAQSQKDKKLWEKVSLGVPKEDSTHPPESSSTTDNACLSKPVAKVLKFRRNNKPRVRLP